MFGRLETASSSSWLSNERSIELIHWEIVVSASVSDEMTDLSMPVVRLTVETAVPCVNHTGMHGNSIEQKSLGGPWINGLDGGNAPVRNGEIDGPLLGGGLGCGETGICGGEQGDGAAKRKVPGRAS